MSICPECETEHDMETCPECDCSRRFSELEKLALQLEDELIERRSDLERAKLDIKFYEKALNLASKKFNDNEDALRNFKWWTDNSTHLTNNQEET